ncbi:MAG: hypothetical protein WCG15_05385 [Actinomycetes bacterium]
MARVYSSTSVATTLAASLSNIATSLTVTSGGGGPLIQGSGFTNGDIFTIAIDPDTQTEEICFVTANSGDVFTVTRGQAGSSAVAHASGATVRHVLTSSDLVFFRDGVTTANAAIPASTLTTKGDLLTRTTATLQRLPVGSNGQVLIADSTATLGLNWAASPTGLPSQTGNGGKYLKTDGSTASWNNVDITISTATGTTYTPAVTDVNKLVQLNNAAAITVTVPASVFSAGQQVNIQQTGAGQVTVQGDGTTVLTSTGASGPAPVTRARYSAATIVCTSSNNFTVIGDLA